MKPTSQDKIYKSLFSDPEDKSIILSADQSVIRVRYLSGAVFIRSNPHLTNRDYVNFLRNTFGVSERTAYSDINHIKRYLGEQEDFHKEWLRYMVVEMLKDSYKLAKRKKDPKGMALAADKIGKYTKLDKDDPIDIPWENLIPPSFEPSPDISVLGFKPDPNIDQRRIALRRKFMKQYNPDSITEAEIMADGEN